MLLLVKSVEHISAPAMFYLDEKWKMFALNLYYLCYGHFHIIKYVSKWPRTIIYKTETLY